MAEQYAGPDPNVLRFVRKCELKDVGDELEARWTRYENRTSLRTLADAGVDTVTDGVAARRVQTA